MESEARVEAERPVRSRELGGAAMYVVLASAAPRAGVEILAVVAASGAAAGAAAGADVDETGSFFLYLLSLAKEALRRTCRCFEALEILLTLHWSGAGP